MEKIYILDLRKVEVFEMHKKIF